jgi:hypothetical protein
MFILILAKTRMWSYQTSDGGTVTYYFNEMTALLGLLLIAWLAWLIWLLISRYRRSRAARRSPRRQDYRPLNRVLKIKNELSAQYLRPGFSGKIHAVGIGLLGVADQLCIQVFLNDAPGEIWTGAGAATLPDSYRGVRIIAIEMPAAGFLSEGAASGMKEQGAAADGSGVNLEGLPASAFPNGIREYQDVIVGGISGANTNLTGQSGTIGYFCTRKSKLPRRKEIHLLSNSHVFVDLRKAAVDDGDFIMQPSPGEPASNRPIGVLVDFVPLKFEGDIKDPNHVDAAIARLWGPQRHNPTIPLIGGIRGYVKKKEIELGEVVRKFGRTTGYTEGRVFSIYLDIRIRYDRTGQSAFFQNQVLIEPTSPHVKFVSKGDSGSLVVDAEQNALGLIFGGTSESPVSEAQPPAPVSPGGSNSAEELKRIEGYGIANPITDVMDKLKIELVTPLR